MMIRLSESSFAGTARTLVAVGISSEACMLLTTRAGAPRSTEASEPATGATAGSVQDGRLVALPSGCALGVVAAALEAALADASVAAARGVASEALGPLAGSAAAGTAG